MNPPLTLIYLSITHNHSISCKKKVMEEIVFVDFFLHEYSTILH